MENSKRKGEEAELTKGTEEQRNRADIYGALFIVLDNFHPVLTNIWSTFRYCPHFTDGKSKAQRG